MYMTMNVGQIVQKKRRYNDIGDKSTCLFTCSRINRRIKYFHSDKNEQNTRLSHFILLYVEIIIESERTNEQEILRSSSESNSWKIFAIRSVSCRFTHNNQTSCWKQISLVCNAQKKKLVRKYEYMNNNN